MEKFKTKLIKIIAYYSYLHTCTIQGSKGLQMQLAL